MKSPYYEDSACKIFLGDCREILPRLEPVDLLLCDPPYGLGKIGRKSSTSSHGGRKAYDFEDWDLVRPGKETFDLMFDKSSEQIIWGANYFSDYLPPSMGWLVWDKGQNIDQSDCELAFTSYDKPLRRIILNRVALMIDGTTHPTQKPLKLMTWCILQADKNSGQQISSILDPFMGSGTTLRAAKDLGRKAIGIEISEKYCEIAAKRLRQEVLDFAS